MSTAEAGSFHPILFVGAGSTGAKIVSAIESELRKSKDPFVRDFYFYLNITSEVAAEKGVNDSRIKRISLADGGLSPEKAIDEMLRLTHLQQHQYHFQRWWPRTADDSPWIPNVSDLATGAGGIRSLGRALLHHANCEESKSNPAAIIAGIGEILREKRAGLDKEVQSRIARQELTCYIFGLLAGGTFSGMVLDLPLLIKQALFDLNPRVMGVFLLGDVCYRGASRQEADWMAVDRQKRNTSYALAELHFAGTKSGHTILAKNWSRHLGSSQLSSKLFDSSIYSSVTLVGAENDAGFSFDEFSAYSRFVADHYVALVKSEAFNRQYFRIVDEQADKENVEKSKPSYPCMFARIGRLGLRPPQEKIRLRLRQAVGDGIAIRFKNADEVRGSELISAFRSQTEWSRLAQKMQPGECQVDACEMGALPETAADFESFWKEKKQQVDAFYASAAPRSMGLTGELREDIAAYVSNCASIAGEVARSALGMSGDGRFSLGTLAYVIKTLYEEAQQKLKDVAEAAVRMQAELYGGKTAGDSLSALFDATLRDYTAEFPEKSLLRVFQRRNWGGTTAVADVLTRYRDALRAYVGIQRQNAAIEEIQHEVLKWRVLAKAVGEHSGLPVFEAFRIEANRAFESTSGRVQIWNEVFDDESDIMECFVQPLLNQPTKAGVPEREATVESVLQQWTGDAKQRFSKGLEQIKDVLDRYPSQSRARALDAQSSGIPSVEQLMQNDAIRGTTKDLGVMLKESVTGEVDHRFSSALSGLNVWEVMRKYVERVMEKTGREPDAILKDIFTAYAEEAQVFPRKGRGKTEAASRNQLIVVGDAKDAEECFTKLGITQENFLSDLIWHAFGLRPSVMTPADASRQEFLFFITRKGDPPTVLHGFEEVREMLLPQPENEKSKKQDDDWNWSDKRFVKWISQWWKTASPPSYLKVDPRKS